MRRAVTTLCLLNATFLFAACASEEGNEDADLSSCGDIHVEASAQCEVQLEGGCLAQCEPVNFTAACQGECNAEISGSCQAECQGECTGQCELDPGNFSCEAECEANCSASCSGQCEADPNSAECQGRCEASCQGECGASCEGTPPSATCEAKCEASCQGECRFEANVDCHLDCQARLEGGCEVECQSPEGALFCDGQYVDHGGNLEECIAALNAYLEVEVDASGSAACQGGTCSAEGEASITCAAAPRPSEGDPAWPLALLGLGLAAGTRRRR